MRRPGRAPGLTALPTYAIGDVQGCYDELRRLTDKLRFDPATDKLWFTGDLVNRGPHSLKVLRWVRDLGLRAITVLGNHDLHLVSAMMSGKVRRKDTFQDVLKAPDRADLLAWLRRQPLLHVADGYAMVHAGLPPQWSLSMARRYCAEASAVIATRAGDNFLKHEMYGDEPRRWSARLAGHDRLRFVINACTRLRMCTEDGSLETRYKGKPLTARGLAPWFKAKGRKSAGTTILFGHWSLLGRVAWPRAHVYGLDTGCVWGGRLTALCLDDRRIYSVPGKAYSVPD